MSKKTRKRIWPLSLAAVASVVATLAVLAVTVWTPGTAQAQTPFAEPSNLEATATSASEISLSWNAGIGQTAYELQRKDGEDTAWTTISDTISGTSYTDSGLSAETTYTYRVRGVNSIGGSSWSDEAKATTEADSVDLDEVPGFTIGHGGEAQQVTVDWDAVTDAHEYVVEYRLCSASPCSGTFTMETLTAADTMYLITGLNSGSQYQVRVTANNADGMPLAQSSGLVSTSRYLLTFANDGVTPSRGHDEDFMPTVEAGEDTTVTATVWVPATPDSDRTDTITVQFKSMDDTADPPQHNGINVDNRDEFTTLGLLAVSGTGTGHGELTIRPRDNDRRSFDMTFECTTPATKVYVIIYDDEANVEEQGSVTLLCPAPVEPAPEDDESRSDVMTVVSYNDWDHWEEFETVSDGFLIDDPDSNVNHMVNQSHNKMGVLVRDEPVVEDYQLAISEMEKLTLEAGEVDSDSRLTKAEAEAGQHTVQVLVGSPNVQLTVTSTLEGPAYIRFLDSDKKPFGTDVDEEPMWRGADVSGLDSQGRLVLNTMSELSKAQALAYDQYQVVIPGLATSNAYLDGLSGKYYQGTFRIFNPCPSDGHHFYVEVRERDGKYLKTTETVTCVASPRPGPTGLTFEIGSGTPGAGELTFEEARNSVSHDVLLIDASNRNIVHTVPDATSPVMFNSEQNVALNNGWTYHIVVVAQGVNGQFTADGVKDYGVKWLDTEDVPLSTAPSAAPDHNHPLCKTGQADVMALLSLCDDNRAPTAVGSIAAQTVMAGQSVTVDVASNFSDADTDDTLTYTAMSDMPSYATTSVSGSMVTITGVAVGTATITVTATDMDGEMVEQMFDVTVTAAELGAPTMVEATVESSDSSDDPGAPGVPSVTITWMDGANADGHEVGLVDLSDYSVAHEQRAPTGMSHTFTNVASGRYMAIVVSTMDAEFLYSVAFVTVP